MQRVDAALIKRTNREYDVRMKTLLLLLLLIFLAPPLAAQTLEDEVRSMRAEIQRLREELEAVKLELKTRSDVSEDLPLVQAQIQEQAQTKVESRSKFPMKVFGAVVSNTFWNTG